MPITIDIAGQRFGRLMAIARGPLRGHQRLWLCRCDCGQETLAGAGKLRYGHKRSCGCLRKDERFKNAALLPKRIDLAGQRYGRWTVEEYASTVRPGGKAIATWRCRCDCGTTAVLRAANLRTGASKSCGCLQKELATHRSRQVFSERWARNTLPRGVSSAWALYKRYMEGAKKRSLGFDVSFQAFVELTGKPCLYCGGPPTRSYGHGKRSNGAYVYNGIDRVDNARGYVPGNMVPCCFTCNSNKKNLTLEQFRGWVARVHARFEGGAVAAKSA